MLCLRFHGKLGGGESAGRPRELPPLPNLRPKGPKTAEDSKCPSFVLNEQKKKKELTDEIAEQLIKEEQQSKEEAKSFKEIPKKKKKTK